MPTKRVSKSSIDSQRQETKENISRISKCARVPMTRKSRRSAAQSVDTDNAAAAVLRSLHEVNNHVSDTQHDSAEETEVVSDMCMDSPRLLEQSNACDLRNSKRMRISTEDDSEVDPFWCGDGEFVAARQQYFGRMPIVAAAKSSSVPSSLQKSASRLSLKNRKSEQARSDGGLSHEQPWVAEGGNHANNGNSVPAVANGDDQSTVKLTDGDMITLADGKTARLMDGKLCVSQVPRAPALKNLGNTCFLNSVLQVLYYTPTFVENVNVLCQEMRTTITDMNAVKHFMWCDVNILSQHCKFVLKLNDVFGHMKFIEQRSQSGIESSALSPENFLQCLESMSPLFRDREQQDSHEFLCCILLYIQEVTRAINRQRALHLTIIQSGSSQHGNSVSLASDANLAVDAPDHGFASDSFSRVFDSGPHSSLDKPQPVDAYSVSATPAIVATTSTPESDCLANSSSRGSSSLHNSRHPVNRPATVSSGLADRSSKKTPSSGCKITSYFQRAAPAPTTVSELRLTTTKVADFVEALCKGKSEMATRCFECECVTRCCETFLDMEVVAQKADKSAAGFSGASSNDDSDDDNSDDKCWIVKSVEEVGMLDGSNKYWCSNCVHHTEAGRSVSYKHLPRILTVHIKRFAGRYGGGYTKCMAHVDIPFVLPCLEANCNTATARSEPNDHWYELYAMVCHSGISLSSGHYVSYVRAPPSNALVQNATSTTSLTSGDSDPTNETSTEPMWLLCNDDIVEVTEESKLKLQLSVQSSTTPYMLFYHRVSA